MGPDAMKLPSPCWSVSAIIIAAAAAKSLQSCLTLSLGFSRQEHWSGLPFPSQRRQGERGFTVRDDGN